MASQPPFPRVEAGVQQSSAEAKQYLTSLLNKNLILHISDSRIFSGEFKCTDKDCNIILSRAFEYRHPDASVATEAVKSSRSGKAKLDMVSRFMGLIVVPGKLITKIETG